MTKNKFQAWDSYLQGLTKSLTLLSRTYDKIAVCATGGVDSSLLVYLTRFFHPVLYYGCVSHKEKKAYNHNSIIRCRKLAKQLNLEFVRVPIDKKNYQTNSLRIARILPQTFLKQDEDLPAAFSVMLAVRNHQGKGTLVISGMGLNEFFQTRKRIFIRYFSEKLPMELWSHEILAVSLGLRFWAPFCGKRSLIFKKGRHSRQEFRTFLASRRLLAEEFIFQPSRHSEIPEDFKVRLKERRAL